MVTRKSEKKNRVARERQQKRDTQDSIRARFHESRPTKGTGPHIGQLIEREIRRRFRRGGCLIRCREFHRVGEGLGRV